MARKASDSFVLNLRLVVSPADERVLVNSIEASRHIYNSTLGTALKRLENVRRDSDFASARAMPKGKPRNDAFRAVNDKHGFTKYALQKVAERDRNACWIGDHLGSHDTQQAAARAFTAVEQYAFGVRGRPRFKSVRRVRALEGKSNAAVLTYRDGAIRYRGLRLPVQLDGRRKEREWQQAALEHRIKYCRVLWKTVQGERRWYAQLVLEGKPPVKDKHKAAFAAAEGKVVGLDLGPSTIAIVAGEHAAHLRIAADVEQPWAAQRRLRRKLDRSRRAMNPQNFRLDGTIKPGPKVWRTSSRYRAVARELADVERVLAARRRTSHGRIANTVRAMGSEIKTEDVSHKAWQKCFGRSAKVRGAGLLQSLITRKAESAGGTVSLINTRATRLSQYCHMRDAYARKPLSQRVHRFPDGRCVQRDLYSAFLATCVHKDRLDTHQVNVIWPDVDSVLQRAVSSLDQLASVAREGGHDGVVGASRPQTPCA